MVQEDARSIAHETEPRSLEQSARGFIVDPDSGRQFAARGPRAEQPNGTLQQEAADRAAQLWRDGYRDLGPGLMTVEPDLADWSGSVLADQEHPGWIAKGTPKPAPVGRQGDLRLLQ